mmetsp:Transcript_30569/g.51469  ORF Transcript_30569/g.51469 Transcript_30569/m.51469 type:complete len:251 (-) Transcript_30569:181-933(-)
MLNIGVSGNQSNAMLALAQLAHRYNAGFTYYTHPMPRWLADNPSGNLGHALQLGMTVQEVTGGGFEEATKVACREAFDRGDLWVPRGGASATAEMGIQMLAREIDDFACANGLDKLCVITPSGTGTTSLYLSKHLQCGTVFTVPCVGDERYLREQMRTLDAERAEEVCIIDTERKYTFAQPHKDLMNMYKELLDGGIEFDMIYAPKTWLALFENRHLFGACTLLYVHSGGVTGNDSQKRRYEWLEKHGRM